MMQSDDGVGVIPGLAHMCLWPVLGRLTQLEARTAAVIEASLTFVPI